MCKEIEMELRNLSNEELKKKKEELNKIINSISCELAYRKKASLGPELEKNKQFAGKIYRRYNKDGNPTYYIMYQPMRVVLTAKTVFRDTCCCYALVFKPILKKEDTIGGNHNIEKMFQIDETLPISWLKSCTEVEFEEVSMAFWKSLQLLGEKALEFKLV